MGRLTMAKKRLLFKLHKSDPHTLSMARLVDYLKHLAIVLGSEKKVHFIRVGEGSADLLMDVEGTEEEKITNRVQAVFERRADKKVLESFDRIFTLLEEDDTPAILEWAEGNILVEFRKKQNEEETFGPFWQQGHLEGMLVKIGGLDETVPVHLLYEGIHHTCNASRELAMELAPHLFRNPIRVFGNGKWYRNAEGKWELHWFDIKSFEPLDDSTLPEIVAKLRAIPGNDLFRLEDPIGEMLKLRISEE
jgi:hypothetical protein